MVAARAPPARLLRAPPRRGRPMAAESGAHRDRRLRSRLTRDREPRPHPVARSPDRDQVDQLATADLQQLGAALDTTVDIGPDPARARSARLDRKSSARRYRARQPGAGEDHAVEEQMDADDRRVIERPVSPSKRDPRRAGGRGSPRRRRGRRDCPRARWSARARQPPRARGRRRRRASSQAAPSAERGRSRRGRPAAREGRLSGRPRRRPR